MNFKAKGTYEIKFLEASKSYSKMGTSEGSPNSVPKFGITLPTGSQIFKKFEFHAKKTRLTIDLAILCPLTFSCSLIDFCARFSPAYVYVARRGTAVRSFAERVAVLKMGGALRIRPTNRASPHSPLCFRGLVACENKTPPALARANIFSN